MVCPAASSSCVTCNVEFATVVPLSGDTCKYPSCCPIDSRATVSQIFHPSVLGVFGAAMDPWTEHRPFGRRVDVGAHSRNAQAVEQRRCARAGGLRPFAEHRVQPELVCLTLSRAATRRIAAIISTRQDEAEVKRILIEYTERGYPSHCTLTRSLMCQSSSSHHPR